MRLSFSISPSFSDSIGSHWSSIFMKLNRARVQRRRNYRTRDDHLVSSTFAWKGPIRREIFQEQRKTRKENYGGAFCEPGVAGGSHWTCRSLRTLLCSPIGRIAHDFSPYTFPLGYLKLLSISSYRFWYLCENDSSGAWKMTHLILYGIKSIVDVIQWYNDTIFKHYGKWFFILFYCEKNITRS